jgi:phage terminase small subunit
MTAKTPPYDPLSASTPLAFGEPARHSGHPRTSDVPAPPAGLQAGGAALWSSVVAEFDLRADEIPVLAELCAVVDECSALRGAIAEQGLTVTGSRGQVRPHPLLNSLNAARATLVRLTGTLGLPSDPEDVAVTEASKRAQHAAQQRWKGHTKVTRESRHA